MAKFSEQAIQVAFFAWVKSELQKCSTESNELRMIMATPNQGDKGMGAWGYQRKYEGASPGFPDISVLVPSAGFHGLFIELKTSSGKLSNEQIAWLRRLDGQGYLALAIFTDKPSELIHLVCSYIRSRFPENIFEAIAGLNYRRA